MAIGTPLNKITGGAGAGTGSNNSGSISTTTGNIVVVFAGCEFATADPNQPTISDTAGWTFTSQYDQTYATGSNPRLRGRIWTATSDGTANTITVTHGNGGANVIGLSVVEIPGASGTLTNFAVGTDIAGDPAITFAAFGGSSAGMVFGLAAQNNAMSGMTGYTSLAQGAYASNSGRIGCWYDLSSPATSGSITSGNLATMLMGFEVLEATGAQGLTPSLLTNTQTFFAPTVTRGAVSLAPGLHTNAQTFYGPTLGRGAVSIAPSLLTNSQTFYAPAVSVGAVTLEPELFENEQTFFAPIVAGEGGTQALEPLLLQNVSVFFPPEVSAAGRWRGDDGGQIWIIDRRTKIKEAVEEIEQVQAAPKKTVRRVVKAVARKIEPVVPEPLRVEFRDLFLEYSFAPAQAAAQIQQQVEFLQRVRAVIEQQALEEQMRIEAEIAEIEEEEDIEFLLMAL